MPGLSSRTGRLATLCERLAAGQDGSLRLRPALAVLLSCVAVLVGVPAILALAGSPDRAVGSRPTTAVAPSAPRALESAGRSAARPAPLATPVPVPAAAPPPAEPIVLEIPRLGVTPAIVPVGVADDGQMALPEDPGEVGWYRYGARPGEAAGSAVLAGHRDSRRLGKGALYVLEDTEVGDRLTVALSDGTRLEYQVMAREMLYKQVLPVDELFARDGPPRLTVITCGGAFVPGQGYEDNVVVTAVPVAGGR